MTGEFEMKEIEQEKIEMSKRMIPSLLCAGIIASMTATPLYAQTSDTEDKTREGTVIGKSGTETSKTVTLEDDGTYTINLEAYSTGSTTFEQTTTAQPLDIVLVMDQSGSLKNDPINNLKQAAKTFISDLYSHATNPALKETIDHRIAIVGFTGTANHKNTEMFVNGKFQQYQNLKTSDYQQAFMPVVGADGNVNGSLNTAIDKLEADGDTKPDLGLKMANNIFENNPVDESRNATRVTILFTDGNPAENGTDRFNESYAIEAVSEAYKTKNTYNSKVYTVGLYADDVDLQKMPLMMNAISSNYPSGELGYEYLPVNNPQRNKTYYVKNESGSYVRISYRWGAWRDDEWKEYNPSNDQFYERNSELLIFGEQDSTTYYLKSDNVSGLKEMFKTIVTDVTNSQTTVSYKGDSLIRDVIERGFTTTDATQVSLAVYKGTASNTGEITFDRSVNVAGSAEFAAQNNVEAVGGSNTLSSTVTKNTVDVTGFNFWSNYVAVNHPGYMIQITITGVLPDEENATFNKTVYTNGESTGIYKNKEAADKGDSHTPFPRPTTYLADKAYVVDYAKRISMNASDWKLQTIKTVSGGYQKLTSLTDGIDGLNKLSTQSGKFASVNTSGATYTPTTTDWTNIDKFFAFGETEDTEILGLDAHKTTKNLWSRISVVPANSVYYEDTFTTDDTSGRVGIKYTGSWEQNGTGSDEYESAGVHGHWSDDSVEASDGTDHYVDAAGGAATAEYSFTGTGTDIYSRTNLQSGTIMVKVTSEALLENGKPVYKKTSIIDTKSLSSGNDSYYTVPTFSVMDLPYGKYNVKLTVTSAAASENRTMYFLDGIRVYNPLNDGEAAKNIDGVYAGEYNAQFYPVKNLVTEGAGVFIDEILENGIAKPTVGSYDHANSPANEIYLNKQQSIVIQTPTGTYDKVYVGLKSHDGQPVNVKIGDKAVTVTSTMDQYYEVTPDTQGCFVIKNMTASEDADNLVSITNIRTAYSTYQEAPEAPVVSALSEENALSAYQTFAANTNDTEDVPGEDVEIDNGDDDGVDSGSESKSWWEILFGGLFGWFH